MAETVSGSTAVMTITPRFLFLFFFLNQKQLIQCNLPHSHTYLKCPRMNMAVIKSHSADEMKTVRRQRQKWGGGRGGGGQETGLESHISTTALRLRHKLLFISIPAACHNYLSPLEGSPRGVGLFHGVEIHGRGGGARPAGSTTWSYKKSPVITKAFRDWSKRKQWKLNGSLLRWSRLELIMNSPLNFFFRKICRRARRGSDLVPGFFLRERARGWSGRRKKGSASPMQPLRWELPGRVERARTALNELFSR